MARGERAWPSASSSRRGCAVIAGVDAPIVNYGDSVGDLGDVAVTPGATYWVEYFQPAQANGGSWGTYWWAGGATLASSDQMQARVTGYNR